MTQYEIRYPKGLEIELRPGSQPIALEHHIETAFVAEGIQCVARREDQGEVIVQVCCQTADDDLAFRLWFSPAIGFYRQS